jgi:hypothetical protein
MNAGDAEAKDMDPDMRLALTGLQFHWHNIYEIGLSPDGRRWSAVRVDTPNVSLAAGTGTELKELIENDHAERKPARRLTGESASL